VTTQLQLVVVVVVVVVIIIIIIIIIIRYPRSHKQLNKQHMFHPSKSVFRCSPFENKAWKCCLTLERGTDTLFRNAVKQLPFNTA